MADKPNNRTSAIYSDNINEIYRVAKINGVTKLSKEDFVKNLRTGAGYRSTIYKALLDAGVKGMGKNQSEFVQYILPEEQAVAQATLSKERMASKNTKTSTPKAKETKQATDVGAQQFGGGQTTALQSNVQAPKVDVPQVDIPEVTQTQTSAPVQTEAKADKKSGVDWRQQMYDSASQIKDSANRVVTEAKNFGKTNVPTTEDYASGRALRAFGGGSQWIDEKGKVHTSKANDYLNIDNSNVQAQKNAERAEFEDKMRQIAIDTEAEQYLSTHGREAFKAANEWGRKLYDDYLDKEVDRLISEEDSNIDAELSAIEQRYKDAPATTGYAKNDGRYEKEKILTPSALQERLGNKVYGSISKLLSDKNFMDEVETQAIQLDMSKETYIQKFVLPELEKKFGDKLDKSILSRYMPKGDLDYITRGVRNWIPSLIMRASSKPNEVFNMEQRADEEYGKANDKKGTLRSYATTLGRGAVEFADPVFPLAFKAGGAIANGVGRAMKVANPALSLSTYAARFGTAAENTMLRLLSAQANRTIATRAGEFASKYLATLPKEMLGQGLGMNIYGAMGAGVNAYKNPRQSNVDGSFNPVAEAGVAMWDALTDAGGFASGAGFAIAMPFIHGGWNVLGGGWKAESSILSKLGWGAGKVGYDALSIGATAGVMQITNNIGKYMAGEDMDWSANAFIHETAIASAMKFNPSMLLRVKDMKEQAKLYGSRFDQSKLGKWAKDVMFTKDELQEIYDATGTKNLADALEYIFPDTKGAPYGSATTAVSRAQTNYLELMNKLSWDAQNKLAMGLTGSFTLQRPRCATFRTVTDQKGNNIVLEKDAEGNILSSKMFKTEEEKDAFIYERGINAYNEDFWRAYIEAVNKDKELAEQIVETVAANNGKTREEVDKIFRKEPLRRTDLEWDMLEQVMSELEGVAYPEGEVHVEKSENDGRKVEKEADVLSDEPNVEAIAGISGAIDGIAEELQQAVKDERWGEDYLELKKQGISDEQAYEMLTDPDGRYKYNEAELKVLAKAIDASHAQQGFLSQVGLEIEQTVSEITNKATSGAKVIDGNPMSSEVAVTLTDADGNECILLSGNITFENGRCKSEQPIVFLAKNDKGKWEQHSDKADRFVNWAPWRVGDLSSKISAELEAKAEAAVDPEGKLRGQDANNAQVEGQPVEQNAEQPVVEGAPAQGGENVITKAPELNEVISVNGNEYCVKKVLKSSDGYTITVIDKDGNTVKFDKNTPYQKVEGSETDWRQIDANNAVEVVKIPIYEYKEKVGSIPLGRNGKHYDFDNSPVNSKIILAIAKRCSTAGEFMSSLEAQGFTPWIKEANQILYYFGEFKKGNISEGDFQSLFISGQTSTESKKTVLAVPDSAHKRSWESEANEAIVRKKYNQDSYTGEFIQTTLGILEIASENGIVKGITIGKTEEGHRFISVEDYEDAVEQLKAKGFNTPYELASADLEEAKRRRKIKTDIGNGAPDMPKAKPVKGTMAGNKAVYEEGKIEGSLDSIRLSDGTKAEGKYVLVDADSLSPSHNPETFKQSEGVPRREDGTTLNDRDYEHDMQAQQSVRSHSANYDERALQDTPVVTKDGIVVSGNDRTMAGQLAGKNGSDKAYIDYLLNHAEKFGFTREQVEQMIAEGKHPRVVMELAEDVPYTTETYAKFNKTAMKKRNVVEEAVAQGKVLREKNETIGKLTSLLELKDVNNLSDLYGDEEKSRQLIQFLVEDGVISKEEAIEWLNDDGVMSDIGKKKFETIMTGIVLDEASIRLLNNPDYKLGKVRQNIAYSIAELMKNQRLGEYSMLNSLNKALELFGRAKGQGAKNAGKLLSVISQKDMHTDKALMDEYSEEEILLAMQCFSGQKNFKNFFAEYNKRAKDASNGQLDMFGSGEPKTKQEITKELIQLVYGSDRRTIELLERVFRAKNGEYDTSATNEGEANVGSNEGTTEQRPVAEGADAQDGVTAPVRLTGPKNRDRNAIGEPEPFKFKARKNKRGDSHDIVWYFDKKKYGSTTAVRDSIEALIEQYGDAGKVLDAWERGEVNIHEELPILKKLAEGEPTKVEEAPADEQPYSWLDEYRSGSGIVRIPEEKQQEVANKFIEEYKSLHDGNIKGVIPEMQRKFNIGYNLANKLVDGYEHPTDKTAGNQSINNYAERLGKIKVERKDILDAVEGNKEDAETLEDAIDNIRKGEELTQFEELCLRRYLDYMDEKGAEGTAESNTTEQRTKTEMPNEPTAKVQKEPKAEPAQPVDAKDNNKILNDFARDFDTRNKTHEYFQEAYKKAVEDWGEDDVRTKWLKSYVDNPGYVRSEWDNGYNPYRDPNNKPANAPAQPKPVDAKAEAQANTKAALDNFMKVFGENISTALGASGKSNGKGKFGALWGGVDNQTTTKEMLQAGSAIVKAAAQFVHALAKQGYVTLDGWRKELDKNLKAFIQEKTNWDEDQWEEFVGEIRKYKFRATEDGERKSLDEWVADEANKLNNNNNERTNVQSGTSEGGSRGQQPNENGTLGGSARNESKQSESERVDGRNGTHSSNDEGGDKGLAGVHASTEDNAVDVKEARQRAFDFKPTEEGAKEALPAKLPPSVMTRVRELADSMLASSTLRRANRERGEDFGTHYEKETDYEMKQALNDIIGALGDDSPQIRRSRSVNMRNWKTEILVYDERRGKVYSFESHDDNGYKTTWFWEHDVKTPQVEKVGEAELIKNTPKSFVVSGNLEGKEDILEKLGGKKTDKFEYYDWAEEKWKTVSGYTFGTGVRDKVARALGKEVPKKPNENNYRRDKADNVDMGAQTPVVRMHANENAIRTLQELMESGEAPTPEQKEILAGFSGWGGLGITTDPKKAERIKELIGEEAYKELALSANSSFYTPTFVARGLWKVAEMLGFKGGKIVEGSAGIGGLLAVMPKEISEASDIHAVEKDGTTGNILKLLYPDAKVDVQGFEETKIENGSVDMAITNVPFVTGLRVKDTSGDADLGKRFTSIHDFCIAKNVRKLKEGGIGIFITSSGTMDSSRELRLWLDNEGKSDVIGAFRLNGETFGGTDATSDIIIVRKRINGEKSPNAIDIKDIASTRTVDVEIEKGGKRQTVQRAVTYNKYYVEHPENMGGEMKLGVEVGDTRFGGTTQSLVGDHDTQLRRFNDWLKTITKETLSAGVNNEIDIVRKKNEKLGKDVKEGSLVVNSKGEICVARQGEAIVPMKTEKGVEKPVIGDKKINGHTKQECLSDYNGLRKALQDVIDYQRENDTDEGLQPLLNKLNKAYDNFIEKYAGKSKMITGNRNLSWLRNDVDFANIAGLENVKDVLGADNQMKKVASKGDIFSKRVIVKDVEPKPENVQDGVVASVFKHGRIDTKYIADSLGKSEAEVRKEIIDRGLGFEDPTNKEVVPKFDYLSGNVREKLRAAEENNTDGKYDKNISELKKVIPMDIPAHMIGINLGANWVKSDLYKDYIKERTGESVNLTLSGGTWSMPREAHNGSKNATMGVHSEICGYTVFGTQLIEAAMRNTTISVQRTYKNPETKETETIKDPEATQACMAKIAEIRDDFRDWIQDKLRNDHELANEIAGVYNDKFNNYVPKSIPDEFVPERFAGATAGIKLHPHQAKAAIRATMAPVLFAHEVGTGKTFTQITTAMEMRRLGTAKKPMIVVQNATTGQFVASAKMLYPGAKILTISDKDTGEQGRKNFYAKIKYNDWDMVIVPQSVLDKMPDSVERQMQFIREKIDEKMHVLEALEDDPNSKFAAGQAKRELEEAQDELAVLATELAAKKKKKDDKKIAKTTENARIKAEEMLERDVDDVEDFDSMGIDAIIVDEAHEYKHLGFATAMQRGVKGVDPSYAKKGQGLYLKVRSVLEKNNGKNVVFATGTPISNTAAETWTFMRYLMPKEVMEEYGIYYFDDFARNFGRINQMLEFTTSGKFRENTRFSGYVNVPELIRIWSSVSDTVLTKDQKAIMEKIPETIEGGDKATFVKIPQTRVLRGIMASVRRELERFEEMDGKEKKANSHIPLVMFGVASKAAIDPRLVLADAEDDPGSKANQAVKNILTDLEESKEYKGTVALFCDRFARKEIETAEDGSVVYVTEKGKVKTDKDGDPIPKMREAFNVYEDIKKKLVENGVPAEQIVIVRSGMKPEAKQQLFDKVNRGEVRVIMGSTQLLGVGVNIQERLYAEHHLDVPNRPMDWTQRLGRMLRQGNLHKDWGKQVKLYTYAVEDSLDITGYQRLNTKGNIAKSIMEGGKALENNLTDRTVEEEEDEFGDIVANLSGSEFALKKQQAERKLRKLAGAKKQWESQQVYIHNQVPQLEASINAGKERKAEREKELSVVTSRIPDGKPKKITIGKREFVDVASMEEFFEDRNKAQNATMTELREKAKKGVNEEVSSELIIDIDGIKFRVSTYIYGRVPIREFEEAKALRHAFLSCDELNISIRKVKGGYLKNAMTEILNEVVSGKEFRDEISEIDARNAKREAEIKTLLETRSEKFEQEEELAKAEAEVEEYTEAMRKEMEEKDKKYAEMDASVEDIDINSLDRELDDVEEEDGESRLSEGLDEPEMMAGNSSEVSNDTEAKRVVTDFVTERIGGTDGLELVMNTQEEGQKVANENHNGIAMQAKLSALGKAVSFIRRSLSGKQRGSFSLELPSATIAKIKAVMGRDYDTHNITANSIVHAKKNHGINGIKNTEKSIPLRDEDFELAPYIMTAPSRVEKGTSDITGRDSIRFYKVLENGYVVVAEKELKNSPDDMETITMWAEKSSSVADARRNSSPAIDVQNVITGIDAAKIRKDAETAIENDVKNSKEHKLTTSLGVVYGWAEGNKIHLTPEGINPNTPIHEYTHLWAKAVQKKAPELWKNIKSLLKDNPLVNEIMGEKGYENLSEDGLYSEVLSRVSGKNNAGKLEEAAQRLLDRGHSKEEVKGMLANFKEAVKKAWTWIGKNLFGIEKFDSVEEVTDRVLYDLVNKTDLGLEMEKNAEPEFHKISSVDKNLTEDDKKAFEDFDKGKTKTVYRAMQVIDGKLYPPMAARVGGEMVEGAKKGDILVADEHPELVTVTNKGVPYRNAKGELKYRGRGQHPASEMIEGKDDKYYWKEEKPENEILMDKDFPDEIAFKFKLDKGGKDATGKKATDVPARYNPYWHTSNSPMNDQFASAWIRPNMVVVECEIPESELKSGYKAEYAKDAVGMVPWRSGSVTSKLVAQGHPGREVYLSRYCKIGDVLSEEKTAQMIKEFIGDKNVEIPENVVTPKLRVELEKIGVKIGAPEKGVNKNEQIAEALDRGLSVDNTIRFSETLDGNKQSTRSASAQEIASHVEKVGKGVQIHDSVETVTNAKAKKAILEGRVVKGYWDHKTNSVHLYLPNIHSKYEAEKTIVHEEIGHKGMRDFFNTETEPNNYNKFMDMIWADKSNVALREFVKKYAPKKGWDIYEAIDEYIAREAEKDVTPENLSFWGKIKHYFTEALRKAGYYWNPNINDVRYAIWLAKRGRNNPNDPLFKARKNALLEKMRKQNVKPAIKDGVYVDKSATKPMETKDASRNSEALDEENTTPMGKAVRDDYDRRLRTRSFKMREAYIDSMESLRVLQELIGGKDVKDSENAYLAENHITSIAEAQWNKFKVQKFQPIDEAINKCVALLGGKSKNALADIEMYIYQKHGLERNRSMFVRKALDKYAKSKAGREAEKNYQYMMENHLSPDDMADIEGMENIETADRLRSKYLNEEAKLFYKMKNGELTYAEYIAGLDEFIKENINNEYDPNKVDYSGISEFDKEKKVSGKDIEYDEASIIENVMSMEDCLGQERIGEIWDAIKKATDFSVDYSYESGQADSNLRDNIKSMYRWYVPLRGWAEDKMEDIYDRYHNDTGNGVGKVLKKAHGRDSLADSPLATISKMANDAILWGERNKMLQNFLRLNTRNQNDAVKISDIWEEAIPDGKDDMGVDKVKWEPALPKIAEDATSDEIADAIDDFNARMRKQEIEGTARKVQGKPQYPAGFKNPLNSNAHAVRVYVNGTEKTMWVTGDPRAAQALRGEIVHKNNAVLPAKWLMNTTAKLATSYSPEFILSNAERDTLFSSANIASKEGPAYFAKFTKNQAIAAALMGVTGIGGDWHKGEKLGFWKINYTLKGDHGKESIFEKYYRGREPKSDIEKKFFEFMDNGGRTGFIAQIGLEEHKDALKASIKGTTITAAGVNAICAVGKAIPKAVEQMNMRAELINRFAVYMTSRQMGRSKLRSVADAKEVSVNFNRHGAGNATEGWAGSSAGFFRDYYMFFNAGMQSVELLNRNLYKREARGLKGYLNPKNMSGTTATKTLAYLGVVPAMVGTAFAMMMMDDDDEKYSNIPSWDRRNNICIPAGDGYVKIALPIELRAFWGMGDIMASLKHKRLQTEESPGFAMAGQISQMMPIDVLEAGEQRFKKDTWWIPLLPTAARPGFENIKNIDWTGKPIQKDNKYFEDAPQWTLAYKSTPKPLVEFCKFVHNKTRDGVYTAQETDATGLNMSPAKVEHVLKSYFSGAYSMIGKTLGVATADEFDAAHLPMLSRVWGSFTEKEADATTNAKYYAYKHEADNTNKEYANKANRTNPLAKAELDNSARGKRASIYKMYDAKISYLSKAVNNDNVPADVKVQLKQTIAQLKRELVDKLDAVE